MNRQAEAAIAGLLRKSGWNDTTITREEAAEIVRNHFAGPDPLDMLLAELESAMNGCPHCTYDEAEGGIINHCTACCHLVTTAAWKSCRKARAVK